MKALAFLLLLILFCPTKSVTAAALGIHVLHPSEIADSLPLLQPMPTPSTWTYVTLPLSLADLDKKDQWQAAFSLAKKQQIIPLVRLTTRFDSQNNAWQIPTRFDIIQLFTFLNQLDWPQEKRHVIIFNEPNHRSEWGGQIDPQAYGEILRFSVNWAHTEKDANYLVLPAAMDLAAPNGKTTMEAFTFLNQMLAADKEVFSQLDYWNSHSYPNPNFSAPANKQGQNSLRGFIHELDWLEKKAQLQLKVFISETGWEENAATRRHLHNYYHYANEHIWSDERVIAVTPFVLKGDPGPFAKFSFLNKDNQITRQFSAYQQIIKQNYQRLQKELSQAQIASF